MSVAKRASGDNQVNSEKKNNDISHDTPENSPAIGEPADKKDKDEKVTTVNPEQKEELEDGNVYEEPKDPLPATANHTEEETDDVYSGVPSNKPLYNAPPDALFTVQAIHAYKGEDEDELSFDAGEIIHVLEFEVPDEQDDGWQLGIKESDRVKGVFPENFTKRVLD